MYPDGVTGRKKPQRLVVGGTRYVAAAFKVLERDVQGRPLKLEVIHEDRIVPVVDGDEFITGYLRGEEMKGREPS